MADDETGQLIYSVFSGHITTVVNMKDVVEINENKNHQMLSLLLISDMVTLYTIIL